MNLLFHRLLASTQETSNIGVTATATTAASRRLSATNFSARWSVTLFSAHALLTVQQTVARWMSLPIRPATSFHPFLPSSLHPLFQRSCSYRALSSMYCGVRSQPGNVAEVIADRLSVIVCDWWDNPHCWLLDKTSFRVACVVCSRCSPPLNPFMYAPSIHRVCADVHCLFDLNSFFDYHRSSIIECRT